MKVLSLSAFILVNGMASYIYGADSIAQSNVLQTQFCFHLCKAINQGNIGNIKKLLQPLLNLVYAIIVSAKLPALGARLTMKILLNLPLLNTILLFRKNELQNLSYLAFSSTNSLRGEPRSSR